MSDPGAMTCWMYSATEGLMEGGSRTWVRSSNVGGEATMLSNFGIFSPLVLLEVKVSTLRTKQYKKIIIAITDIL